MPPEFSVTDEVSNNTKPVTNEQFVYDNEQAVSNYRKLFTRGSSLTKEILERVQHAEVANRTKYICGYEFKTRHIWSKSSISFFINIFQKKSFSTLSCIILLFRGQWILIFILLIHAWSPLNIFFWVIYVNIWLYINCKVATTIVNQFFLHNSWTERDRKNLFR